MLADPVAPDSLADPPSPHPTSPATLDSPEKPDLKVFPETPASLDATVSPATRDHPAHPVHLETPERMATPDPRAHPASPAHRESAVSAPNTAQPMVVFSSRMAPGSKRKVRWSSSSSFRLSPVCLRTFITTNRFHFYNTTNNNSIRSLSNNNNNNINDYNAANHNTVTSRFCKDVFCIDHDHLYPSVLMLFLLVPRLPVSFW
jgi:hypothetical protein